MERVVSADRLKTVRDWLGSGSVNVFGRQYAGKDTQCARLASEFDGVTFGGGDILRNSGEAPPHVLDAINGGGLSPTDEYRSIVTPYFDRPEFANKPLFLSSVGRMAGEELTIMEAAARSHHPIKAAIHLSIDEATVWERFHITEDDREVRIDDHAAGLAKRLRLYEQFTLPVLETYDKLGLLITLDGTPGAELVYHTILHALYKKAITA